MGFSEVGVVGYGPGGCEVAMGLAEIGLEVRLVRASRGSAAAARARIERRLAARESSGELTPATRERIARAIHFQDGLTDLHDLDLLVDATHRGGKARRALLATLEGSISEGAVLATTAPDELDQVATALRRPDQMVALEIVGGPGERRAIQLTFLPDTAPGVRAACVALCQRLGRETSERPAEPAPVGYREFQIVPAPVT